MSRHVGAKRRDLDCACCGGGTEPQRQWTNQDTGYGLCQSCATWMVEEYGYTIDSIRDSYGEDAVAHLREQA